MKYMVQSKFLRRYRLRILSFLCMVTFTIMMLHNWEYRLRLKNLQTVVDNYLERVSEMALFTSTDLKMKDTWRRSGVEGSRIFSAYLDSRPEVVLNEYPSAGYNNLWALVRIIAIVDVQYKGSEFICHYKFSSKNSEDQEIMLEAPSAAVKIIAESENFGKMKYSAAFVLCKLLTKDDGELPSQITFSSSSGKKFEELLDIDFVDIHYYPKSISFNQIRLMAVCVPTLHHNYDKYMNLIEFIEFYWMMGVDHFTIYNSSASENVSLVLEYYKKLGILTVIQWQLPPIYKFERTLRYNGIFAAMNDCLYRSSFIGGYKYIVNVDLDEFIVPRRYSNYPQLMDHLDPIAKPSQDAVFIFRNMFFYLIYEDSEKPQEPPNSTKLLLHTKTTRLKDINEAFSRTKYICRGLDVVEMGNHQVWYTKTMPWFFQNGFQHFVVDPEIAASHHYRYCEVSENICWLLDTVVDETAQRFTKELARRVMASTPEIQLR
ncbi:hypothetical protein QAD02_016011 [Eretmocerus hayati]|uniref:Uncharacterized protein n=1 Tax=Eretmocerus hayati TaxID=131215 RepID=A0ACC2PCB2_9HYME|nr:hypothetical protein QAD02_016011 [Eretmocerus hayati]